jgi:hypothetical protein
MGVLSTIMDVGHSTGPMAAGMLVMSFGYQSAFTAVGALLLAGTVAFWLLSPRPASPQHKAQPNP